jgi:hypothetical protein
LAGGQRVLAVSTNESLRSVFFRSEIKVPRFNFTEDFVSFLIGDNENGIQSMRGWQYAAHLPEFDRPSTNLPADDMSNHVTVVNSDKSSFHSSTRHFAVSASARLRPFQKLSMAAGLPMIDAYDLTTGKRLDANGLM